MKKQIIRSFLMGMSFIVGISAGYVFIFAAMDWSNLTTNVGSGSTLTTDLWNNSMTNIKNNTDTLSNSIDSANTNMGKFGTVVTVWGRTTAPAGSTLLYSGYGFGGHYTHNNGSKICMKGGDAGGTTGAYGDLLYPLSTGNVAYMPPGVTGDKQVLCSEVYVNSTIFETYGTDVCPANWSILYKGYSMGYYYTHAISSENPICMDAYNFDSSVTQAGVNGSYLVGTRVWQSANTTSHPTGKFVKCAVCYKN